jgi:predicted DNA-binding protein with PD1-like motif
VRTLAQPGAPLQPRRLLVRARGVADLRVVVPAGADLLTWLEQHLDERGVRSAGILMSGGSFATMQYLTGQPDRSGARVATYGAPTTVADSVLVSGNAIYGRTAEDRPLVHCHAVVVGPDGRVHGGHLPPRVCTVAPDGIVCWVTALAGAAWRVSPDSETNYAIFHPEEDGP